MKLFILFVLFATSYSVEIETEDEVLVLTKDNFDQAILENDHILVEFYAPWCGHCKQLSPVWDKLAETFIAEKKDDIVVAKMDATINELSHTKVRSFPTIRLYRKGTNEFGEYNGERKYFFY